MAFSAHKDEYYMTEHFDTDEELEQKVDLLVEQIKRSKHFIVFTGAGISTSAGISDFRGPQGVWTLKAQGKQPKSGGTSTTKAVPTQCHMSLVALQNAGIMKYLISQNCDGLHRRSGIDPAQISELHGNSNIEECEKCGKQYLRDFACYRIGRGHDHYTGRHCVIPNCNGRLLEYTIDFGQSLPQVPLEKAYENAKKADLCLVLGSSLTVSPACDMPKIVGKKANLFICNLQKTPLEKLATANIHTRCDTLMDMLLEKLGVTVPQWTLNRKLLLGYKHLPQNKFEFYVNGIDYNEEHLPASIFRAVEFDISSVGTKTLEQEPFIIKGNFKSNQMNARVRLHFMKHYKEPSLDLLLPITMEGEGKGHEIKYTLIYDPYRQEWQASSNMDQVMIEQPSVQHSSIVSIQKINTQSITERRWGAHVYDNNSITCFGGVGDSSYGYVDTFDIQQMKWTSSSAKEFPMFPRWGHTATLVGNTTYIIGGFDHKSQYNDLYMYEPGRMGKPRINGDITMSHRAGHSATAVGTSIVVFGGAVCEGGPYTFFDDVHVFDIQNRTWTKVDCNGERPSPRSQHSATLIHDDTIVVIGGYNGTTAFNDVYTLDLNNWSWSRVESKGGPAPITNIKMDNFRIYHAQHAACLNGSSIVTFGLCKSGFCVLDTNQMTWRSVQGEVNLKELEDSCTLVNVGQKMAMVTAKGDMYAIDIKL
jgi:NAD-dependent SIR2 family protein deacetylase